jgi:hypothetical protein
MLHAWTPNASNASVAIFGGSGADSGAGVAVDASGNVYVTGSLTGTVDFDPGVGTANLSSAGETAAYVVKLDSAGSYVWARTFGGSGADSGAGVAVDASGNVYVTGSFTGTADFDPGVGTANLISAGRHDAYVVKLDSAGSYVWARNFGGSGDDLGAGVAVDVSGNVVVTGRFWGTADFDPGVGTANLSAFGPTYDAFVVKLTSAGSYVWARNFNGSDFDSGAGVAVDVSGNVVVTGTFWGTADFDPGVGTANLTSAGRYDAFVVKLDSAGSFVWARTFGGSLEDEGSGIVVDASGNVYVKGSFAGTADFDPGVGTANLMSAGRYDAFVVKLDSAGSFVWARNFGGSGDDLGAGVAVDVSGNVYVTGSFAGTADFDPGVGTANLISAGESDAYVVKLNSSGVVIVTAAPPTTAPATTAPEASAPATTTPLKESTTSVRSLPKLGRVQRVGFRYTLKEPYQATVRWSKPKGSGDRFISYAVYLAGRKNEGPLCRTYQLSCVITDLYPNERYRFYVEASSSNRQITRSKPSKTLITRLPRLERQEMLPPSGWRDVDGRSCNDRLQNESLNYWPVKSIPGFVRLQSDCSGRVLFMSKTPVQISPTILTRQKSSSGSPDFFIRDDALELSLSSIYEDDRLVESALSHISKQFLLRRWERIDSIVYPYGCVAQRNDFIFERGQVWGWLRSTPGWGRNCELRFWKETVGQQTRTVRMRWTYPTVCVAEKCDVVLNLFQEPELSYLRLVIVVEE